MSYIPNSGQVTPNGPRAVRKAANGGLEGWSETTRKVSLLDLPPFPAVAVQALRMVSNNDARLRDLHNLISTDQTLASEILRAANSPLYGIRSEIKTTLQAVMLLGFERVRALTMTVAMRSYASRTSVTPALEACWRHSLATALIAEELAGATSSDTDISYTAGLLHDIGKLALAVLHPEDYNALVRRSIEQPCHPMQEEKRLFGIDHCQAGRWLVKRWGLPEIFAAIAGEHHERVTKLESDELLDMVQLSCAIAGAIGIETVRSREKQTYDSLHAKFTREGGNVFPEHPEDLAQQIESKISAIRLL